MKITPCNSNLIVRGGAYDHWHVTRAVITENIDPENEKKKTKIYESKKSRKINQKVGETNYMHLVPTKGKLTACLWFSIRFSITLNPY